MSYRSAGEECPLFSAQGVLSDCRRAARLADGASLSLAESLAAPCPVFFSTAQALCLANQPKPVKEYRYPEKLPGELYDANTQCKWQFGEKAKLCMLDFKKASDYWQMPSAI